MVSLAAFAELRSSYLEFLATAMPQLETTQTPSKTVFRDRETGFALLHYLPEVKSTGEGIVLVIPHFVNRPYILDLNEDVSVIGSFCSGGFDVYMIDWGFPTRQGLSFFDFAQFVKLALTFVPGRPHLLGYCTGGIVSLIFASLNPGTARSLVLLATPVDFSAYHDPRIITGKMVNPRLLTGLLGNIPGELMNYAGALLLSFYMPVFAIYPQFLEEFFAPESWRDSLRRLRWLTDAPAIPASVYIEFIEGCYQKNLLINNKLKVAGQPVDLRQIKCPVLNVMAKFDHIIPVNSAASLVKVYSGTDYREIVFPSSHVGLSTSRSAHFELWPEVRQWLKTA